MSKVSQSKSNGGNYEPVKFNALKHGILSQLVVLPHEDKGQFDTLLSELCEEYQPVGVTECYLVEELAGIMWRKRRILLAEGASINRGIYHALGATSYSENSVNMAIPFDKDLTYSNDNVRDTVALSPKDNANAQEAITQNMSTMQQVLSMLEEDSSQQNYETALNLIPKNAYDSWEEAIQCRDYPETAEELALFIREFLIPQLALLQKKRVIYLKLRHKLLGVVRISND